MRKSVTALVYILMLLSSVSVPHHAVYLLVFLTVFIFHRYCLTLVNKFQTGLVN